VDRAIKLLCLQPNNRVVDLAQEKVNPHPNDGKYGVRGTAVELEDD